MDEAVQLFDACYPGRQGGHRREGFFRDHSAGWQFVAADGSVHYASHATAPSTWRAAMQVDDGTDSPIDWYGMASHAGGAFRWGNLFRLALFLLIVVLPLPWFWRKPARAEQDRLPVSVDSEATCGDGGKRSGGRPAHRGRDAGMISGRGRRRPGVPIHRAELTGMATGRCAPWEHLMAGLRTSSGLGESSRLPGNRPGPGRIHYPVAESNVLFE